jgi:hypothetical protein
LSPSPSLSPAFWLPSVAPSFFAQLCGSPSIDPKLLDIQVSSEEPEWSAKRSIFVMDFF